MPVAFVLVLIVKALYSLGPHYLRDVFGNPVTFLIPSQSLKVGYKWDDK